MCDTTPAATTAPSGTCSVRTTTTPRMTGAIRTPTSTPRFARATSTSTRRRPSGLGRILCAARMGQAPVQRLRQPLGCPELVPRHRLLPPAGGDPRRHHLRGALHRRVARARGQRLVGPASSPTACSSRPTTPAWRPTPRIGSGSPVSRSRPAATTTSTSGPAPTPTSATSAAPLFNPSSTSTTTSSKATRTNTSRRWSSG